MNINTEFLTRCIRTLEMALEQLPQYDVDDVWYDIFRASCVKEFELILEQSGSLLKRFGLGAQRDGLEADRQRPTGGSD